MRHRIGFVAWCLSAGLSLVSTGARADSWPDVKSPPNAETQAIATDMLLNGKPCRISRFDVHSTAADVLQFYRGEMGARHVENRVKNDQVIATRQGDYFVTVQLHALDGQTTQGTVMTTLMSAKPATSPVLLDTQKMLPSETQVVSTVQTADDGKRSLIVIGVNLNSVQANKDHIVAALMERGFRPAKSDPATESRDPRVVSLQLSSPAEEASVTISDDGARRSVTINRVRDSGK